MKGPTVPLKPDDDPAAAQTFAWFHALVPILDIAIQDLGPDNDLAESVAITNALASANWPEAEAHQFRLATTKIMWLAIDQLSDPMKRKLASIAAGLQADTAAVLETALQTPTLPEFVKAMTYPDGDLPSMHEITDAAILAVRLRFRQDAEHGQMRRRWRVAAELLTQVGR